MVTLLPNKKPGKDENSVSDARSPRSRTFPGNEYLVGNPHQGEVDFFLQESSLTPVN